MQDIKSRKPGIVSVIASVLAAGLGVQSERNRERDFRSASPYRFIIAGIIGTILFVVTMYAVVKLVLQAAG